MKNPIFESASAAIAPHNKLFKERQHSGDEDGLAYVLPDDRRLGKLLGFDAAEIVLLRLHVRLVIEQRRMAWMRDEVCEIRALRQMARGGSRRIENDKHRAWLQIFFDIGRNPADVRVRHR